MIRSSYLRVYQPLELFSAEERAELESQAEAETVEATMARRWLVSVAIPEPEALGEGAFVRNVDGRVYVCPWRTRLRMLAGLLAFRSSIPDEVADAFVPEDEARKAAHELQAIGRERPEVRSHILQANWHVPLRWFAAFDESQRVLVEDRRGVRLRYESPLDQACERLERAHSILDIAGVGGGVSASVGELLEWLQSFESEGLVELDYGSVAGLFSDESLVDDQSAADVWTCLSALAEGDLQRAANVYSALNERWNDVRVQELLN